MFIGHYGLALAAKRTAPRVSLGASIAAAQLVDLIWPVLLLAGLEQVRIVPNANPFLRLSFVSYPWTHSLLMGIVWAVIAGYAYAALRGNRRGGVIIGLLVVSHWVLDWLTHLPDLPLYPGGPRVGLGLWRSFYGTMVVEAVIFVVGLAIYARATRATDQTGRWGLVGFFILLAVLYVANAYGPPPTSAPAVAWGALGGWLVPLFGWWVDRHRAAA
jgi:LexA-binding, inner membrane-associated putative hydrolase